MLHVDRGASSFFQVYCKVTPPISVGSTSTQADTLRWQKPTARKRHVPCPHFPARRRCCRCRAFSRSSTCCRRCWSLDVPNSNKKSCENGMVIRIMRQTLLTWKYWMVLVHDNNYILWTFMGHYTSCSDRSNEPCTMVDYKITRMKQPPLLLNDNVYIFLKMIVCQI